MGNYHFGSGSFKNELWIKQKFLFTRPEGVDVEFITPGAFDWIFSGPDGKVVLTHRHANPTGGWTSIDFMSLGLSGDHSIGFRNTSGGEKKIKQGDVRLHK